MDGFGRAIGDAISGVIDGAMSAVSTALAGIGDALATAMSAGVLPVVGIAAVLLVLWLLFRR